VQIVPFGNFAARKGFSESNAYPGPGSTGNLVLYVLAAVKLSETIRLTAFKMPWRESSREQSLFCEHLALSTWSAVQSVENLALSLTYEPEFGIGDNLSYLQKLPVLKTLRLCFHTFGLPDSSLDGYVTADTLAHSLDELELFDLGLSVGPNNHFLLPHRNTLKSLVLDKCSLNDVGSVNHQTGDRWVDIFRGLKSFRHLRHLTLYILGLDDFIVSFPTQGRISATGSRDPYWVEVHEGEDMASRLQAVIDDCHLTDISLATDLEDD
jgi:hypothetical protein